jgi:hypothetical protein
MLLANQLLHPARLLIHRPQLAKGFMQLYSFEQQKSQPLEAHAAGFASIKVGCHVDHHWRFKQGGWQ